VQHQQQHRRVDRWSGDSKPHTRDNHACAQLTNRTKGTVTPGQLLALLQQHSADFDHINVSAAFTHAKKLCRTGVPPEQQPAAVQQLLQHLHQLAEQLQQQQCGARELANIMSSCGHLRLKSSVELLLPEFLQDSKLQQAQPQAVSNTLWSVATLDMQPSTSVVLQLVQHFRRKLPQAEPQHVSNTLWAVDTLGTRLPESDVQQLVQHFIQVLPQAKPQEVPDTLGAVARMGHTLPADQLEQFLAYSRQQLHRYKPQALAETLWACGRMHYAPLQLLSALEQQPQLLTALLAAAGPQGLANMALACGQLGYRGKLLPGALLQQAVQLQLRNSRTHSLNMQDVCNLSWSAAVLDMQQNVPQVLQLVPACSELWDTADEEGWRQLYQVHLWLLDRQLPAPGQGLSRVLSPQQLQQGKHSLEQQLQRDTAAATASDTQMSVFAALQALPGDTWQQPPVLEQRTADGALSIDVAATTRSGVCLTIEVDGPSHFVQPGRTFDGRTLFRNRALAARGYVLVSIPYWEWDKLGGAAAKQQYLLSKLQAAEQAVPLGSSSSSRPPAQQP
jgi:hypothetical protein